MLAAGKYRHGGQSQQDQPGEDGKTQVRQHVHRVVGTRTRRE
jgi:hypothetical protein